MFKLQFSFCRLSWVLEQMLSNLFHFSPVTVQEYGSTQSIVVSVNLVFFGRCFTALIHDADTSLSPPLMHALMEHFGFVGVEFAE